MPAKPPNQVVSLLDDEIDVHPEGCVCRDCEHAYWAEVEAHEAYIAGIEVA